jgi:hypothetical protein
VLREKKLTAPNFDESKSRSLLQQVYWYEAQPTVTVHSFEQRIHVVLVGLFLFSWKNALASYPHFDAPMSEAIAESRCGRRVELAED